LHKVISDSRFCGYVRMVAKLSEEVIVLGKNDSTDIIQIDL